MSSNETMVCSLKINYLFKSIRTKLYFLQFRYMFHVAIFLLMAQYCTATIDLSNVDLNSFRFFRYINPLPNGDYTFAQPPPPSIADHLKRAKASKFQRMQTVELVFITLIIIVILVAVYFRNVVLGNTGYDARSVPFTFNPNVEFLQANFQQKYGIRGEKLIEQLGNGEFLATLKARHQHKQWQRIRTYPSS